MIFPHTTLRTKEVRDTMRRVLELQGMSMPRVNSYKHKSTYSVLGCSHDQSNRSLFLC